jgi:energy-coupling factor transporter ATP-binding protein EcfA2
MDILSVRDVAFEGVIAPKAIQKTYEQLKPISLDFTLGKSYLINTEAGEGGWALSWVIAGILQPTSGVVEWNYRIYPLKKRREDTWVVRRSEIRRFGLFPMTVQEQIQCGLKTAQGQYLKTEEAIIQACMLSPQRYRRLLRHLSHEGWRASCAIGLAHGKKIFCFSPFFDRYPQWLDELVGLWFKDLVQLLTSSGALVIVPTKATPIASTVFDEIVQLRH